MEICSRIARIFFLLTRPTGIRLFSLAVLTFFCTCASASTDKVSLQLRWYPQFQFAGYYMAQAKGFYQEEGIELKIIPGNGNRTQIVEEVLSNRADFGIGNSGLALSALKGQPVTVIADIFQRSAAVLLTRPGIEVSIEALSHRKLSLRSLHDNPELYAVFNSQGIGPASLNNIISADNQFEAFARGETDAFNGYLSNEPFLLKEKNIDFTIIDPVDYGLDFYGDTLFTTNEFARNHPDLIKRFVRATIKGWAYALDNITETVDFLHAGPVSDKSKAHLFFEAQSIEKLIMSDLIPLGQINNARWEKIAEIFKYLGLAPAGSSIKPAFFITYWTARSETQFFWLMVAGISCVVTLLMGVGLWYRKLNRRLRRAIEEKNQAFMTVQDMAHHDQLTGLPNRRLIYDRVERSITYAHRHQHHFALCLIDLNGFKLINDRFGHLIGDQVLQALAVRLSGFTRESDSIGRFGGDEFILVINGVENMEELNEYLSRLRTQTLPPIQIGEEQFTIDYSIGAAFYPQDGMQVDQLVSIADMRMYKDKSMVVLEQPGRLRAALMFDRPPQIAQ